VAALIQVTVIGGHSSAAAAGPARPGWPELRSALATLSA
jgi:hypothetical protein